MLPQEWHPPAPDVAPLPASQQVRGGKGKSGQEKPGPGNQKDQVLVPALTYGEEVMSPPQDSCSSSRDISLTGKQKHLVGADSIAHSGLHTAGHKIDAR